MSDADLTAAYGSLVKIEEHIISAGVHGTRLTAKGHPDPWRPMSEAIDKAIERLHREWLNTVIGMLTQDLVRMTAMTESLSAELAGHTGEDVDAVCQRHEDTWLAAHNIDPEQPKEQP